MARVKSWGFTLPGQPISWNRSYHIVQRRGRGGRSYGALAKTPEAVAYQNEAIYRIKRAKPAQWKPEGQVRVTFRLFLQREVDCDNVMKLIHDAIEKATGINDKYYLPTVAEKSTRWGKKARVEVIVEDLGSVSQAPRTSSTTRSRSSTSSATSPSRRHS